MSSYQKLKAQKEYLELVLQAIIERPYSSEARAFRELYKIENDLK